MTTTLMDVAREAFLFTATFKDRLETDSLPPIRVVRQEARAVINSIDRRVQGDPHLRTRYEEIRYGLIVLIDEIVIQSGWSESMKWRFLEEEMEGTMNAGFEVYNKIEALRPTVDDDLAEIWFYILALGFKGQYHRDQPAWEKVLVSLIQRLPLLPNELTLKLTPEAYQVIERDIPKLDPLFKLWRAMVYFCIGLIGVIVLYHVVWDQLVQDAEKASIEVLNNLNNEDLKSALRNQ